jgi:hypothetical protein
MNIKTTIKAMDVFAKSGVVPFFWGEAGVGKSTILRAYAEANGYEFVDLRLSQMDPGDLLGLADLSNGSTKFAPPSWLPRDPKAKVFILFDELNRARRDTLNAIFQLALDRRLHEYVLPKACIMAAAGNPATDDYVTTDLCDHALLSRFCHVAVEPTHEETMEYLSSRYSVDYVQFLKERGTTKGSSKTVSISEYVKPNNRSQEMFMKVVSLEVEPKITRDIGYGLVGLETTSEYYSWKESQDKALTFDEVITQGFKAPVKKRLEAAVKADRMDYINASNTAVFEGLKTLEQKDCTEKVKKAWIAYISLLPKDSAAAFGKNCFTHCLGMINAFPDDEEIYKIADYLIPEVKDEEVKAETKEK